MRPPLSLLLVGALAAGVMTACAESGEELHASGHAPEAESVIEEADGTGVETSQAVFEASDAVVVAAPDGLSQGRAASFAIALRAPMLTVAGDDGGAGSTGDAGAREAMAGEVERLGATRVIVVGEVDLPGVPEDAILAAPTGAEGAEDAVEGGFSAERTLAAADLATAVAEDEGNPLFTVAEEAQDAAGAADAGGAAESEDPSGSDYDGPLLSAQEPVLAEAGVAFLATDDTPVAAVATARASGAHVDHLPAPDPRVDGDAVAAVIQHDNVVALGPGWGPDLGARLETARTMEELPGGGQVLFPGRRMVALYGSPITPAIGVLGEQGPEESVARVQELVDQYRDLSPEPVIPAFEIIGTVAAQEPGPDGNYTNEWDPAEFVPLVDAITAAGGYAVIDLQPGKARFLDQVQPFRELLERPGVGLALDPEWKLADGQQPGAQVGSVSAAEINEVTEWLADLTAETGGPQKLLILHQFQAQMITERETLDTSREEVAVVVHADGHGTAEEKFQTWDMLLKDLPGGVRMAWKNFYDEDRPMFTPEETMAVEPRPWFVSYQ